VIQRKTEEGTLIKQKTLLSQRFIIFLSLFTKKIDTRKGIKILGTAELLRLTLEAALVCVAALIFIPSLVLFLECVAALLSYRSSKTRSPLPQYTMAVLVPAHNEASGIAHTLAALQPELAEHDRLVVIADNCTDETASIARETGAIVIERHDTERRGKGYALDCGVNFLQDQPPDVVVIVDADCVVSMGALAKISQQAMRCCRPVQATYLLSQPAKPSPKDAVSMLAFTVKNLVRPAGLGRFNLPCPLTGTGMAFPWEVLRRVTLASGNIVEDMNLGLDLALAGYPTMFCTEARVTGSLPQQRHAAKSQRTRWEHGHLQTITTQVPKLIAASVRSLRIDLLAIALDLLVPPVSLLVMLWIAATALATLGLKFGTTALPISILGAAGAMIAIAILAAWAKYCRQDLPAKMLLAIPLYVLWKVPLYFAFLFKPQTQWVRTDRDTVEPSETCSGIRQSLESDHI
jgi:cellulose synthase/poly-beta-1,6-N-acetylglucosamine synthase-like glycosyltransferase